MAGVLFIPLLLEWGGAGLVLLVTVGVHLLGALVTFVFGRAVLPRRRERPEPRRD